ncbi:MAG: glycosyltransferase family 4 protein, partial [Methanothrix sp.]|nr:glycosyltransferase family 4 protein [Methanothrix sp.]
SYRILNERTAKRADHVITVGSDIKIHLVAKGIPADKISVIPSGVDAQAFRPREGNKARSCLFAGSLIERKGVEYLLGAMSQMPQEFSAVIAGDGPRRNSLMKMAEKERIGNRIVFTGAIAPDQLAKLYSEASFFILPSLSEGLPITILEAMSCGCPVIATRVSAIGDAVVDGYNGLLIRPRDVDDLREKMMVLLQDPELRDRMGRNARETIESTYTWQSVARRIMTVYERVLADRR